jgi:hypothetical protein
LKKIESFSTLASFDKWSYRSKAFFLVWLIDLDLPFKMMYFWLLYINLMIFLQINQNRHETLFLTFLSICVKKWKVVYLWHKKNKLFYNEFTLFKKFRLRVSTAVKSLQKFQHDEMLSYFFFFTSVKVGFGCQFSHPRYL